jgi:hypothetical protein
MKNLVVKRGIYALVLLGIIAVCLYPPMEVWIEGSNYVASQHVQHRFLFSPAFWESGTQEYRATVAVGRLVAYSLLIGGVGLLARLGIR